MGGDGYTEGLQFIDGSFVEEIERIQGRPPNDIDVFSLLSAPQKYLSDPVAWQTSGIAFWKQEVIDRERNKLRLALDTYAILTQEMSLSMLVKDVIYWYGLFAHQRGTFAWKGFTIVPLDVAGDKAALATLGSA